MRSRLLIALAALLEACVVQEIDLADRRCPCGAGWTCDEARDVCVEGTPPAPDAGRDASHPDAGSDGGELPDDGGVDGGAIDGGPGDAGMPDAGPPPDPTACDDALAGAILCDGFEADDGFAAWSLGANERDGTATRVTDVVYRGNAALRTESTAATGYARLTHDLATPATSGTRWMRTYVYVPSASDVTHLDFLGLREAVDPFDGVVAVLQDRSFLYVHEVDDAYGMAPLPERDRWACVEVEVVISDTAGEIRLYIDGAMHVEATAIDTLPASGHGRFGIGLLYTSSLQGPTTMYFDEVALGTERLPCDP